MKEHWWKYALLALAAMAWWFIQTELTDFKTQNKAQWQEAAKTKQCLFDELARVKERLSHIEGWHDCERQKGK